MSTSYISPTLRQQIAALANHRCSYCQTQTALVGRALQIDHIIPETLGGFSVLENLCLACSTCNQKKGAAVSASDPLTNEVVSLYNPHQQAWHEHFQWSDNGLYIVGLTAIGRATVNALDMNNNYIVRSRRIWVEWNVHPPK